MTTTTPSYFYIEPATWESWVAALGFTAASKLAGACMTYFFTGALGDDVKLTKTAQALFEGERARLDNRRAKAAAKAARAAEAAEKACVEKSRTAEKKPAKSSDRPRKNQRKNCDSSEPAGESTSRVPAETASRPTTHLKPKPNLNNPQTPTPRATGGGRGGGGVMSAAEFAALAGTIGYDSPTAYGGTLLRAV